MRSAGRAKRTSALLMAGVLATLGPGVVPLPAAAQDDGERPAWAPPPVTQGPPADLGQPDKNYVKEIECVARDVEADEKLSHIPWGQKYLRIQDVHELMQSTVGSAGQYSNGQPVRVAVIDTGVTRHPFLENRLHPGEDYVKDVPPGPGLEDCDGHGTEVAGIIAADTPEDIGFKGVAPDSVIVSIRQSSQNYKESDDPPSAPNQPQGGQPGGQQGGQPGQPNQPSQPNQPGQGQPEALRGPTGSGETSPAQDGGGRVQGDESGAGTTRTLAQAIVFAVDSADVDVINISINNCRPAGPGPDQGENELQRAIRYAVEQNVVVVSAAGNTSEQCKQNNQDPNNPRSLVTPPWFYRDVLSVAAIDQTGSVADFSMHGPWVSVAAPGTDIISLDPAEGSGKLANQTIEGEEARPIQGTSFAAPYVTGLAALVRAKYPHLDAREVMDRIKATAHHPAAPGGNDNFIGYGVIDPMAALTATVPSEEGIEPAKVERIASDLPPAGGASSTPLIVALAGSGGALAALLITLFVVHTIRRNRPTGS